MVIQAAWSHHVHSRQVDRSAAAAAAASVAATGSRRTNGRLSNVLYDAFEDEEDAGAAGVTEAPPAAPLLDAHGPELSNQLRYLRRRLKAYLDEQAGAGKTVALVRGSSGGLHPTMEWTIQFGKWLASMRVRQSKASRWEEKAWKDGYQRRQTKGSKS